MGKYTSAQRTVYPKNQKKSKSAEFLVQRRRIDTAKHQRRAQKRHQMTKHKKNAGHRRHVKQSPLLRDYFAPKS